MTDWSKYPNFSEAEFRCQETGEIDMDEVFLQRLQELRNAFAKPMTVTSGYRSPKHSIEAKKPLPGAHAQGKAVDIRVSGEDAYQLVGLAMSLGFTGIGVQQKGASRFIHLDIMPRKAIWSY
jgi:zinc D-Ala-D-Ala carboxypeptidase